jgi:hypothetical protein
MIFLTNEWTHASMGHAREELGIAKGLLSKYGLGSQILSRANDFGDLYIKRRRIRISKVLPKRGPIYYRNKANELQSFGDEIQDTLNKRDELTQNHVIFTSMHGNSLRLVIPKIKNEFIRTRLISLPTDEREWEAFIQIVRSDSLFMSEEVFVETRSQARLIYEKVGFTPKVVPPISGLVPFINSPREKVGRRIGIFWPIANPESDTRFRMLINQLKDYEVLIRPPGNLKMNQVSENIEILERNLGAEEFVEKISGVDVAILPHFSYSTRGSSLASMFTGLGIPIIANSKNSFYEDLEPSGLCFPLEDEHIIPAINEAAEMSVEARSEAAKAYRANLNASWLGFLKEW